MKTAEERFWAKVDKNGPLILKTRCWVWTASRNAKGYGHFRNGKTVKAYRWSYEFHKEPIPKGLCVCHTCDNPPCVNPDHLFVGTNLDNTKDRNKKGRNADMRGELNAASKLNEKQVLEIRSRPYFRGLTVAIAKEFHVNHKCISDIRTRRSWRHI